MEKYKVDYRVFDREPLLSSSTDYVFSAIKLIDSVLAFCVEVAEFDPKKCRDIVEDFVAKNPDKAGKTFWVQQNCYRLEKKPYQYYQRISFASFRIVDDLPVE